MLQLFGGLVLVCIKTKFFASEFAFDSIFQSLQDVHTFALLQSQQFSKTRFEKYLIFVKFQQQIANNCFAKICKNLPIF